MYKCMLIVVIHTVDLTKPLKIPSFDNPELMMWVA